MMFMNAYDMQDNLFDILFTASNNYILNIG
jgi:hypothetical protein